MCVERNAGLYERRWSASRRVVQFRPHLWRDLARLVDGERLLEIGPGLRPTIPVEGSFFVDLSRTALDALARRGGRVALADGGPLPFADEYFGGVFAFEVLEHVQDDTALVAEMRRVLRPGGTVGVSVPLRMSSWTRLDDLSAHVRRYEPDALLELLERAGFLVEAFECTRRKARPALARLEASIFEVAPRVTDAVLHSVYFPLLAARQRRRRSVRWAAAGTPIPPEATGITVLARRKQDGRPRST